MLVKNIKHFVNFFLRSTQDQSFQDLLKAFESNLLDVDIDVLHVMTYFVYSTVKWN